MYTCNLLATVNMFERNVLKTELHFLLTGRGNVFQIKSNQCYVYSPKSQSHSLSGLCSETRDSRKEKRPILKNKKNF